MEFNDTLRKDWDGDANEREKIFMDIRTISSGSGSDLVFMRGYFGGGSPKCLSRTDKGI